jgi:hypothetical protein
VTLRTFDVTISAVVFLWLLGILIAQLFGSVDLTGNSALSQIVSSQLAFGLLLLSYSFKLFSFDSLVRVREVFGGLPLKSMFAGKLASSMAYIWLLPFAYVCGNFPFIESRAQFVQYFGLYFFLACAISGLANFLAVTFTVLFTYIHTYIHLFYFCFQGDNKNLISTGTVVILWCFGGVLPEYLTIRERLGLAGVVINHLSPFKMSLAAQVSEECVDE